MIKKIIQTLFVSMLLLFAVPIGAFAANTTTTNTTINNTTAPVVGIMPVVNTTPVVNVTPVNTTLPNVTIAPFVGTTPVVNTTPVANTSIGTSVTNTTVSVTTNISVNTQTSIANLNSNVTPVVNEDLNTISNEEVISQVPETVEIPENQIPEEIPQGQEISTQDSTIISDFDGAQMRLYQLQNRVDFQVEAAGMIMGKITQLGKESQFNMTALNAKVNELRSISISVAEFDTTSKNSSQVAEEFVALKMEAITISKAFKSLIGDGLTIEDRAALKKLINKKNHDRKLVKDSRIEKLKKKFNQKQVIKIAEHFNTDPAMIEKYKAGEYTDEQVKNFIKQKFNSLSETERVNLKAKISESDVKHKINLKQDRKRFEERAKSLREEHRKSFENRKSEIENKFNLGKEDRKRFENKYNKLSDNQKSNLKQRFENGNSNLKQRYENEKQRFENHNSNMNGDSN